MGRNDGRDSRARRRMREERGAGTGAERLLCFQSFQDGTKFHRFVFSYRDPSLSYGAESSSRAGLSGEGSEVRTGIGKRPRERAEAAGVVESATVTDIDDRWIDDQRTDALEAAVDASGEGGFAVIVKRRDPPEALERRRALGIAWAAVVRITPKRAHAPAEAPVAVTEMIRQTEAVEGRGGTRSTLARANAIVDRLTERGWRTIALVPPCRFRNFSRDAHA